MTTPHKPILLYDADCGFCSLVASKLWLLQLDTDVVAMQRTDLVSLGVDDERARRDMPFVASDGRVEYGHRAWAAALCTGNRALRAAGAVLRSPVISPVARGLYAWVSTHRHLLPGGTAACTLDKTSN